MPILLTSQKLGTVKAWTSWLASSSWSQEETKNNHSGSFMRCWRKASSKSHSMVFTASSSMSSLFWCNIWMFSETYLKNTYLTSLCISSRKVYQIRCGFTNGSWPASYTAFPWAYASDSGTTSSHLALGSSLILVSVSSYSSEINWLSLNFVILMSSLNALKTTPILTKPCCHLSRRS